MTKPITSVAIMMLYEQGKLGLDDPVSKYIPEFKNPKVLVSVDPLKTEPAKGEITIRQLLTHTSGLALQLHKTVGSIYDRHGISGGISTSRADARGNDDNVGQVAAAFHPGEKISVRNVHGRARTCRRSCRRARHWTDSSKNAFSDHLAMNDTLFKVPNEKLSTTGRGVHSRRAMALRKVEKGETTGSVGR